MKAEYKQSKYLYIADEYINVTFYTNTPMAVKC